jgi:hypothetical protein
MGAQTIQKFNLQANGDISPLTISLSFIAAAQTFIVSAY